MFQKMFKKQMTIKSLGSFKSMCERGCMLKICNNFKILDHVALRYVQERF